MYKIIRPLLFKLDPEIAHHLTLQEQKAVVDGQEFANERETVLRLWRTMLEN